MIVLAATTSSIQIKLSGTVTTNQLPFSCSYVDISTSAYTPGENDGVTNNSTAVTIASAPAASTQRVLKSFWINNADTASQTITIIYNNNGTLRNFYVTSLSVGDTLQWTDTEGFSVFDSSGELRTVMSGGGGGSGIASQIAAIPSNVVINTTPPTSGQALVATSSTAAAWQSVLTGATNYGTAGIAVYDSQTGSSLNIRSVEAGSTNLTVTLDAAHHAISVDANIGTSSGTLASGADSRFLTASTIITSGSGVVINNTPPSANQILLASSGTAAAWTTVLSSTTPANVVVGSTGVVGTGTTYARADHSHQVPTGTTSATVAIGNDSRFLSSYSGLANVIPVWTSGSALGQSSLVDNSNNLTRSIAALNNNIVINTYATSGNGNGNIQFQQSNSNTLGIKTQTVDTQNLGGISFTGTTTGSNFGSGPSINAVQVGTSGASFIPAKLLLSASSSSTYFPNQLVLNIDGTISTSGAVSIGGAVTATNISSTPAVSTIPVTTGGAANLNSWITAAPANAIVTSGTNVAISSTAPTGAGAVLVTTSATAAAWSAPSANGQVPYATAANTWTWASPLYTSTPSADTFAGAVGASLLASPGNHIHPAAVSTGLYVNSGSNTVTTTAAATPTGAGQILSTTATGTAAFAAAPTTSNQILLASGANTFSWAAIPAAISLGTTGTAVTINTNAPTGSGQVLTTTSTTNATWQTVAAGPPTSLATSGSNVVINTNAPTGSGQVLMTTSTTNATWQTPAGGVTLDHTTNPLASSESAAVGARGLASDSGHIHPPGESNSLQTSTASAPVVITSTTPVARQALITTSSTVATWQAVYLMGAQVVSATGGTTTFTSATPRVTIFTGANTQTVVLPDATTLYLGQQYEIDASSTTGPLTIQTNGGATLWTMVAGTDLRVTLTNNGTTAGTWDADYSGILIPTAKGITFNDSMNFATNASGAGALLSSTGTNAASWSAPSANGQVPYASAANTWSWASPLSSSTPAAESSGVAGAAGSSLLASRADHVHAMPTLLAVDSTTPSVVTYGSSSALGSSAAVSRADHVHGLALVPLSGMATLAANSIIGNNTGSSATPIALTVSQVQTTFPAANIATSGTSVAISSTAPTGAGAVLVTTSATAAAWSAPSANGQVPYATAANTWTWASPLYTSTPAADTFAGAVGASLLASPGNHIHPAAVSTGLYVNSGANTVTTTAAATPTGAGQILSTTAAGTAAFAAAPASANQVLLASGANTFSWSSTVPTNSILTSGTSVSVSTTAPTSVGESLVTTSTTASSWQPVFVLGTQSVATAGTTTTLTNTSPTQTIFTGTNIQTIVLPAANTLPLSAAYEIINQSTGLITIQANGGTTLAVAATGAYVLLNCTNNSTSTGTWQVEYLGQQQPRGTTTVAMAGTTTTLTAASTRQQLFTGSGTTSQTVVLPDARTIPFNDWHYEIDNASTGSGVVTVQTNGGAMLATIPAGVCAVINLLTQTVAAGTWDVDFLDFTNAPLPINSIDIFGHSWFDYPTAIGPGLGNHSTTNMDGQVDALLAGMLGIERSRIRNHAVAGSSLTAPGKSKGGFARALGEITRKKTTYPFSRAGGCTVFCWNGNDVGFNTPANQSLMLSAYTDCLTTLVSRARASVIYNAQTGAAQWTFGTNFANGTAANNQDFTGQTPGIQTSVVDSSGTSTATFTIPYGYKGEPICFALVGQAGATGGCIVTWGGTVTGTTSIVGTTTNLNSRAVTNQSIVPVRFTAATNGLGPANAGQTITLRITTASGGPCIIDSVWIESLKPDPVIIINGPLIVCKKITYQFGDGVTTGATTNFTSAAPNAAGVGFATATDAGNSNAIIELDAQGAFTAGKTVASVTNSTTLVLSAAATGAFTNIKYSIDRVINGYGAGLPFTNTDFTSATISSHATADSEMTAINTANANVQALFDTMVQIADCYTALGSTASGAETNLPAGVYSYTQADGVHPNDLGCPIVAKTILQAIRACNPPATDTSGALGYLGEVNLSQATMPGSVRNTRNSGGIFTPEFCTTGAALATAQGQLWGIPMEITESTEFWSAMQIAVTASTSTGTNIRWGIYDDVNRLGYPQLLRFEGSIKAVPASTGILSLGSVNLSMRPGLWWLALKIDALGGVPTFLMAAGPNRHMPSGWASVALPTPIAWLAAGGSAGALPNYFPTGGTVNMTAPLVGVTITVQ